MSRLEWDDSNIHVTKAPEHRIEERYIVSQAYFDKIAEFVGIDEARRRFIVSSTMPENPQLRLVMDNPGQYGRSAIHDLLTARNKEYIAREQRRVIDDPLEGYRSKLIPLQAGLAVDLADVPPHVISLLLEEAGLYTHKQRLEADIRDRVEAASARSRRFIEQWQGFMGWCGQRENAHRTRILQEGLQ